MESQRILIDNRHEEMLPTRPLLQKTEQILSALGYDTHELSLVIMNDAGIRELNSTYRGKDSATNVLSFSMQEGEFGDITPDLLGDVVISVETAQREADEAGITLAERMSQLLVHGILHLVGFDHERGESEAGAMEAKSLELLRQIEQNTQLDAF